MIMSDWSRQQEFLEHMWGDGSSETPSTPSEWAEDVAEGPDKKEDLKKVATSPKTMKAMKAKKNLKKVATSPKAMKTEKAKTKAAAKTKATKTMKAKTKAAAKTKAMKAQK